VHGLLPQASRPWRQPRAWPGRPA